MVKRPPNPNIPARLRDLIKRSGVSMAEISRRLGYKTPSGFQHYLDPDKFQQPLLPLDLALELVEIIANKGQPPVTEVEIMDLAGAPSFSELGKITDALSDVPAARRAKVASLILDIIEPYRTHSKH